MLNMPRAVGGAFVSKRSVRERLSMALARRVDPVCTTGGGLRGMVVKGLNGVGGRMNEDNK